MKDQSNDAYWGRPKRWINTFDFKKIMNTVILCLVSSLLMGLALSLLLSAMIKTVNAREAPAIIEALSIESDSLNQVRLNQIKLNQIKLNEVKSGSLLFKSGSSTYHQAMTLSTDVDIKITGMIARVTLKQSFKNMGNQWLEGVYVFPLPENSAVDKMKIQIADRVIIAEIKERHEANKIYQKARKSGKKAALIEQERANLFTNSIANIAPQETVIVEIEYQQRIDIDNAEFSLRFPMAITPRYIPNKKTVIKDKVEMFEANGWSTNVTRVKDASRITPPVWQGDEKINPVTLSIDLNSGFPLNHLSSLYHKIKTNQIDEKRTQIQLAEGEMASDRDFVLTWKPQIGKEAKAALFSENFDGDIYHLLMVMPPNSVLANTPIAREVIFIIDTSGSMGGASMIQAKNSLKLAIERLKPADNFNIISFNSTTDVLFSHARKANEENVKVAIRYAKSLTSGGGTEMKEALEAALKNQKSTQPLRQVVFLTDGSVGNEDELFQLIKEKVRDSRLFTVGIGSAPNSHFMRKAAEFGRGTFTYIGDVNEVQDKMSALFKKLETASMTNIQINFEDNVHETYPQRIPDLYFGEPLIIITKTTKMNHAVTLSGERDNQQWISTLDLSQAATDQSTGIATRWARDKITSLMDGASDRQSKDEIKSHVIEVALKHHLVSKYTSLVAVEERVDRPSEVSLKTNKVPVNLSHGQNHMRIIGFHAQTATGAPLNFVIGISLLLIALFFLNGRIYSTHFSFAKKRRISDEV